MSINGILSTGEPVLNTSIMSKSKLTGRGDAPNINTSKSFDEKQMSKEPDDVIDGSEQEEKPKRRVQKRYGNIEPVSIDISVNTFLKGFLVTLYFGQMVNSFLLSHADAKEIYIARLKFSSGQIQYKDCKKLRDLEEIEITMYEDENLQTALFREIAKAKFQNEEAAYIFANNIDIESLQGLSMMTDFDDDPFHQKLLPARVINTSLKSQRMFHEIDLVLGYLSTFGDTDKRV